MVSIFDDALLVLGRSSSVTGLAAALRTEATEAVQEGVVLSLPVIIAGLAHWSETPEKVDGLAEELVGLVELSDVTDFESLNLRYDVDLLGDGLLERILGERTADVGVRIAARAGLPTESGRHVLTAAAATVLVRLANRYGPQSNRELLAAELTSSYRHLSNSGWQEWIAETTSGPDAAADSETMATSSPSTSPTVRGTVRPSAAKPIGSGPPSVESSEMRFSSTAPVPPPEPASSAPIPRSSPPPPSRRPPLSRGKGAAGPTTGAGNRRQPGRAVPPPTRAGRSRLEGEAPGRLRTSSEPSTSNKPPTSMQRSRLSGASAVTDGAKNDRFWMRLLGIGAATGVLLLIVWGLLGGESEPSIATDSSEVAGDEAPATARVSTEAYELSNDEAAAAVADTADQIVTIESTLADPLGRITATGSSIVTFDRVSGEVCYEFVVDGLGDPYDGHIHVGPAGVKGGIVVDYGELRGNATGCLANSNVDTESILADLAGHYIEFHDPDGINTIRSQLAGSQPAGTASGPQQEQQGGAAILIESGAIVLSGDVPDQVTIDKLLESFADIDLGSTQLTNRLTIVDGAPRPSGRILVDDSILFAHDSDVLTDPESTVLADLATIFNARPAWRMTVVGHTDSTGTEVYNLELSLRRAAAVRAALIAAGVSADALTIQGAGDTDPIASNDSPEGRAQNRRIEFDVIAG